MQRKKWTFKGITRFFPNLNIEHWIKICKQGLHRDKDLPAILKEGKL
jgi:hypothetical protein